MVGRTNFITNGSFEFVNSGSSQNIPTPTYIDGDPLVSQFPGFPIEHSRMLNTATDSFPGWTISGGSYWVNYFPGGLVIDGSALTSPVNGDLTQNLSGLTAGAHYDLSFETLTSLDQTSPASLQVIWDGKVVRTFPGLPTTVPAYHIDVTATGGVDKLEFKYTGVGILDDVRLIPTTGVSQVDESSRTSAIHLNLSDDTVKDTLNGVSYQMSPMHAYNVDYSEEQQLNGISDVTGSAFDDLLHGSAGANSLLGGAGNDLLVGAGGNDILYGGDGNDSITTGADFSIVNGNKGDDSIVSQSKVGDWLSGGQGNDKIDLSASSGHSLVNGNLGDDTITAGSGGDVLRGGQGADVIHGGAGNDWISGDRGADTMDGGAGADSFHFGHGSGADQITDFSGASGDRIVIESGMTCTISKQGADVLIDFGSGDSVLLKYQTTTFDPSWIVSV